MASLACPSLLAPLAGAAAFSHPVPPALLRLGSLPAHAAPLSRQCCPRTSVSIATCSRPDVKAFASGSQAGATKTPADLPAVQIPASQEQAVGAHGTAPDSFSCYLACGAAGGPGRSHCLHVTLHPPPHACTGVLPAQITDAVTAARIQLAPLLKGSSGAISKSAPAKKKVGAHWPMDWPVLPHGPALPRAMTPMCLARQAVGFSSKAQASTSSVGSTNFAIEIPAADQSPSASADLALSGEAFQRARFKGGVPLSSQGPSLMVCGYTGGWESESRLSLAALC